MKRRVATLALAVSCLALAPVAASPAHIPGSDGGASDRSCGVLAGVSKYGPVGVGASGRVSCRIARGVARGSVRGRSYARWRCTGKRTRFGHCHGRGARRGSTVHWFAAH